MELVTSESTFRFSRPVLPHGRPVGAAVGAPVHAAAVGAGEEVRGGQRADHQRPDVFIGRLGRCREPERAAVRGPVNAPVVNAGVNGRGRVRSIRCSSHSYSPLQR